MKISSNSKFGLIIKFMLGGTPGFAAGFGALYILTEWVKIWYPISAFIAGSIKTVLTFAIQKFWTFNNREIQFIHRQAVQYGLMTGTFTITGPILLYALVQYTGMWYMYAHVITTLGLGVISYYGTRWIFTR